MNRILVINSGSSSLKFKLFNVLQSGLFPALSGLIDRIGESNSRIALKGLPTEENHQVPVHNHTEGLDFALKFIREKLSANATEEVRAVGHRIVHGGTFSASVVLDEAAIKGVEAASAFAPLHNPPNLMGVAAAKRIFHGCPQVGVFDTSFHQSMKPAAYLYGLPLQLYKEHGIRRYGFHGTSYKFLTQQVSQLLKKPQQELNLVLAHLGAGSSMCAVQSGKSIDTSMGMTPLEGLVMGSRSGDIDPGLLPFLSSMGLSVAEIDKVLNKKSGLLGLGGSVDLRPILEGAQGGDTDCQNAIDVYVHRIRKYLGAYMLQLGGKMDALVFSAGIGENSAVVRKAVCLGLEAFGIEVCDTANAQAAGPAATISTASSRVKVLVVATDEELSIAQDTARLAHVQHYDSTQVGG